jgi:hypothetical protein
MDGRFSITRGPAMIALVSALGVAGAGALAWSLWSRGTTPDAQSSPRPPLCVAPATRPDAPQPRDGCPPSTFRSTQPPSCPRSSVAANAHHEHPRTSDPPPYRARAAHAPRLDHRRSSTTHRAALPEPVGSASTHCPSTARVTASPSARPHGPACSPARRAPQDQRQHRAQGRARTPPRRRPRARGPHHRSPRKEEVRIAR